MARLVLINGPIASGKSTLTYGLARAAREAGHTSAAIELDLIYQMLEDPPRYTRPGWRNTRQAAGALADHFWSTGVELVVVEGDLHSSGERQQLLAVLGTPAETLSVTLTVSFDEALRRALADPTRVLSKNPEFLRRTHDEFNAILANGHDSDLLLETDALSPDDLVARVMQSVFP